LLEGVKRTGLAPVLFPPMAQGVSQMTKKLADAAKDLADAAKDLKRNIRGRIKTLKDFLIWAPFPGSDELSQEMVHLEGMLSSERAKEAKRLRRLARKVGRSVEDLEREGRAYLFAKYSSDGASSAP
jgi:hypothetical protein